MQDYFLNQLKLMYQSGKNALRRALHHPSDLLSQMKETVITVPHTAEKIQQSPNLQFILSNSIFINGVEFMLPFVGYYGLKKVAVQVIKNMYPNNEEDSIVVLASNTIDCAAYTILFTRLKLKNLVFNSAATVGAAMKLNDEFSERVQIFPPCRECTLNLDRLSKQVSLELHYVYGTAALSVMNISLNKLPYIGTPLSMSLAAYWLGILLFQYPLARNKVCAEHQIVLLMNNRSRVFAHGLFLSMILYIAIEIANVLAKDIISNNITTAAVTNMLMPLFLMHTHQLDMPLKTTLKTSPKNIKALFDLVFIFWALSSCLTEWSGRMFLLILNQDNKKPLMLLEKMKSTLLSLSQTHNIKMSTDILLYAFVAPELQTLEAFSLCNPMRPYMILFLKNMEAVLQKAHTMNNSPLTQLTYFALKTTVLKQLLLVFGAYIAKSQAGIPHALTTALLKMIEILNINDNLAPLHEQVKLTYKRSVKEHERNPNHWCRFFSFGSRTPSAWLRENDFVLVPHPQEATTSRSAIVEPENLTVGNRNQPSLEWSNIEEEEQPLSDTYDYCNVRSFNR